MDQELHMLRYWVEDKGIETAFEEYYPKLAKTDPILRQALKDLAQATYTIQQRVKQLSENAMDDAVDD